MERSSIAVSSFSSAGLGAAVFVRLVFNPAVFEYTRAATCEFSTGTSTRTWSARSRSSRRAAAPKPRRPDRKVRLSKMLTSAGAVLLFLLLNIEIADYYSTGAHLTFNFTASLGTGSDLHTRLGRLRRSASDRGPRLENAHRAVSQSILLLLITIGKCLSFTTSGARRPYRVGSLVGLAIKPCAIVALLIQRFVHAARIRYPKEAAAP